MCSPLSCCHGRSTSPLCTALHQLLRLLLASARHEPGTREDPRFHARLDHLWRTMHRAAQAHYRVGANRAHELMEQAQAALLDEECCRQSLLRLVPLAEVLGYCPAEAVLADYATREGESVLA